jgi:hypothetical protein
MSSADVVLLAVSGAVTVCSLALVATSVRLQRRPGQSEGKEKLSNFPGTSEVPPSQEVSGDTSRASDVTPSQKRIMLTPAFEESMRNLDKSSQSRLYVYITRLASGRADLGRLYRVPLPQGGNLDILSVRLDGKPFQIAFSTTSSAKVSELLLVDLLPGSSLVPGYAQPQPADKNTAFDAIIDSSFTESEKEILRAATDTDL